MTDTVDLSALGRRMKSERKRQGLTLEALSERIGISRNFLWEIEDGRKAPALHTLYQLGVSLELSVDYLLGLSPEKKPIRPDAPATQRDLAIRRVTRALDGCGPRELELVSGILDQVAAYLEAGGGG